MSTAGIAEHYEPAARAALRSFPIAARDLELVAVSENVTFRVTDDADGKSYVLRLHRPGYHSLAALDSERLWTRALDEAGVAVPRPVAARDGRFYVPVSIGDSEKGAGEVRYAGLMSWTEGEVLSDVMAHSPDLANLTGWFGQLGEVLAAMHVQSSQWRPPPAFVRHHLDRDGLLGDAPFWGRFWEHPILTDRERVLILRTRDALREVLARYGKTADRYSVIHADLHPGNVLIDDGRLTVIDFDDTGFGWHLYDIAVALTHQHHEPHFPAVRDALLDGYRSVRPLPPDTDALLPMFLLIRAMVTIGWLYQRPEHSSPEHVQYLHRLRGSVVEQCRHFSPPG